jgi:hypothetical protein
LLCDKSDETMSGPSSGSLYTRFHARLYFVSGSIFQALYDIPLSCCVFVMYTSTLVTRCGRLCTTVHTSCQSALGVAHMVTVVSVILLSAFLATVWLCCTPACGTIRYIAWPCPRYIPYILMIRGIKLWCPCTQVAPTVAACLECGERFDVGRLVTSDYYPHFFKFPCVEPGRRPILPLCRKPPPDM